MGCVQHRSDSRSPIWSQSVLTWCGSRDLNASQSDCCWEFSNPLCHCAYSTVYRDLTVAKFSYFIWYRIRSVDTVRCCQTLRPIRTAFCLFFYLLSLWQHKIWKPCHHLFYFTFPVHVRLMNWQFWQYDLENWLILCLLWLCLCVLICRRQ